MSRWRVLTWLILGWTALMVAGVLYVDGSIGEGGSAKTAEGLGIALIVVIWFVGFIVLSLFWFLTRPARPRPARPARAVRSHPMPPNCRRGNTLGTMPRRADSARIDEARQAATRNRLIGEGATEETADAWIAAWAEQAARDGVERGSGYWQAGWEWIATQRKDGVRP